jgi:hypothetical protein
LNLHHQQLLGLLHDQLEELFEDACFYSAAAAAAAASLAADAAASLAADSSSASLTAAVAVAAAEAWQEGLQQVVYCMQSASPVPQYAFRGLPLETESQDCGFQ